MSRSFTIAIVLGLAMAFASHAFAQNPIVKIQTVTLDDLKNALADANAQTPAPGVTQPAPYNASVTGGDVRHGNCWAALIDFVSKFQAQNVLPAHPGLATLQQKIFDDQQLIGKPLIPDYVIMNCALTFNDAQLNLVQVANWLGLRALPIPKLP